MTIPVPVISRPSRRQVASVLARDALAEMALDLAVTAEAIADYAPRASLPMLEKSIFALRAGVLQIGMTLREAQAAEAG
jgi:hypothetical protein